MASVFDAIPEITPKITHFKGDRGDEGTSAPDIKFRLSGRKPWYTLPWSKCSGDLKQALQAILPLVESDYRAFELEMEED